MICLKLCRLLELGKGILLRFKFCCYGNQNQNYCLLLKKTKGLLFKQKRCLKQYSLIATAGSFEEKWAIHSSYCEKTIVFCF